MPNNAFSAPLEARAGTPAKTFDPLLPPVGERVEGAWRVLPIEGRFEIVYEDSRGAWTTRMLDARELKLGPGRTLLGGVERERGLYRGFRADRIRRLVEPETGLRIETGILDWLLARCETQRRARRKAQRTAIRSRSRSTFGARQAA